MRFPPLVAAFLLMTSPSLLWAAEPLVTLPLWPGDAPGEKGDITGAEADITKPTDGKVAGQRVSRIGNVTKPTLSVYPAPKDKNTGAAVVVCPGGGYGILAYDLEGTEICEWLNSIGVTGILLKYRVPVRPGVPRYMPPLQDAQRAMGIVREHASEWGIESRRIGVLGFSAGGHLAAALSTNYEERAYAALDAADALSCRPDFAVLIYPAYLTRKDAGDAVSAELKITAQTPPTFLVQTHDDPIRVETSVYYYLGLHQAKVPAEMHLYPSGGHGYGLRPTERAVTHWPEPAAQWLRGLGMLERAK